MSNGTARITLRVVEKNALAADVDVLVLKHADALYGLDKKVVRALGIDAERLPKDGDYRAWPASHALGAGAVIFVGVPPLHSFGYLEIRRFASRALAAAASEAPGAKTIGLTLHGAGYGLDEVESFHAEVAGILDATSVGKAPSALREIHFFELDPGRARRMVEVLAEVMPSATISAGRQMEDVVPATPAGQLRSVGHDTDKRHAFVAMPFAEEFDDILRFGISTPIRDVGLLCERIDQQAFTGDVVERMKSRISSAALVVADLTGARANVFLEVGYAWGKGVPTVLVCKKDHQLEFDVQGQKCLYYGSIHDLETKLTAELTGLFT
jgi:hypothetical protein